MTSGLTSSPNCQSPASCLITLIHYPVYSPWSAPLKQHQRARRGQPRQPSPACARRPITSQLPSIFEVLIGRDIVSEAGQRRVTERAARCHHSVGNLIVLLMDGWHFLCLAVCVCLSLSLVTLYLFLPFSCLSFCLCLCLSVFFSPYICSLN